MRCRFRVADGLPVCNLLLSEIALPNAPAQGQRIGMRNTWNVDAGHSSIVFSIRHLLIAKVRGRFSRFGGVLDLDDADLTKSKVSIEVETASIDTALEQRDTHLKSADFFDVAQFPKATFTSKGITKNGDEYDVHGELSLHGVTREVVLKATFGGTATDARGRVRVAFEAKTTIDRGVFGLKWNQALEAGGVAIGPKAELEIDLQAIKA